MLNPNRMSIDTSIQLTPEGFHQLKLDRSQLLKGIAQLVKTFGTNNLFSLPASSLDTIAALKLEDTTGSRGWKLVSRALARAVAALIAETDHRFRETEVESYGLDQALLQLFESKTYALDAKFFQHPADLELLADLRPHLTEYWQLYEFTEPEIQNVHTRLGRYLVFALVKEWQTDPKYYEPLREGLETPFLPAETQEREWEHYRQYLQAQVQLPVFDESFSLEQVYVPLRAYYLSKPEASEREELGRTQQERPKKIAVDLQPHVLEWLVRGDAKDAIRMVRGGPGYGKSSFFKMLAAHLAGQGQRVLFIPLHRFSMEDKLEEAVTRFLGYDPYLTHNPITVDREPLILIFDGLDELTMQGKALAEVAQSFIREVERTVSNYNASSLKLQVLISGRDVIIQQNESDFKGEGQILRLMEYRVDPDEFKGDQALIGIDQRDHWWQEYGQVSGHEYEALPDDLRTDALREITVQPLLNYMIALSYIRGEVQFDKSTNLNEIYEDLLKAVYERGYDEKRKVEVAKHLEYGQFQRMLEEVALATWHGNGRTCTVNEINQHFGQSKLSRQLEKFKKDAEQGIFSLLTAFYFRQAGQTQAGYQTFEFTHKSFGEYLVARRFVAHLRRTVNQYNKYQQATEEDEGWSLRICLVEWIRVFGPTALDWDLVRFIRNEVTLLEAEVQQEAQVAVAEWLSYVIHYDAPMEGLNPRIGHFSEEVPQARHAKVALLVMHSLIANQTGQVSDLNLKTPEVFGIFCHHLRVRAEGRSFFRSFLNQLNLDLCVLSWHDLSGADLSGADLHGVYLVHVSLVFANLSNANLSNANLNGAILCNTILNGADLRGADLRGATLRGTYLEGATLTKGALIKLQLEETIGQPRWVEE